MTAGASSPTVGVAIPTRDRPEFLAETIESVLAGTRVPETLQVVDNSQRDPAVTESICRKFGSRVTYLAPVGDLSMQHNHNRAIQGTTTDLTCILHDDDLYGPHFLERGVRALADDPSADLFAVNYEAIDEQGDLLLARSRNDFPVGSVTPLQFLEYAMGGRSPIHLSASILRTAAAQRCALAEVDENCADMGFFFQLMSRANAVLLDEPLVSVRVHRGMESAKAGFHRFGAKRESQVLPIAPLEWQTKDRFLRSLLAETTLGESRAQLRKAAASRAIHLLLREARERTLPLSERLRLIRAAAQIVAETRPRWSAA